MVKLRLVLTWSSDSVTDFGPLIPLLVILMGVLCTRSCGGDSKWDSVVAGGLYE